MRCLTRATTSLQPKRGSLGIQGLRPNCDRNGPKFIRVLWDKASAIDKAINQQLDLLGRSGCSPRTQKHVAKYIHTSMWTLLVSILVTLERDIRPSSSPATLPARLCRMLSLLPPPLAAAVAPSPNRARARPVTASSRLTEERRNIGLLVRYRRLQKKNGMVLLFSHLRRSPAGLLSSPLPHPSLYTISCRGLTPRFLAGSGGRPRERSAGCPGVRFRPKTRPKKIFPDCCAPDEGGRAWSLERALGLLCSPFFLFLFSFWFGFFGSFFC